MTHTNINQLVKSSTNKINHGPCKICRKPILYEGGEFCSLKCQSSVLKKSSESNCDYYRSLMKCWMDAREKFQDSLSEEEESWWVGIIDIVWMRLTEDEKISIEKKTRPSDPILTTENGEPVLFISEFSEEESY